MEFWDFAGSQDHHHQAPHPISAGFPAILKVRMGPMAAMGRGDEVKQARPQGGESLEQNQKSAQKMHR